MSNYLWFDSRQVISGTTDLVTTGNTVKTEFKKLTGLSRIAQLEQGDPAGTDDTGQEFQKWYDQFKATIMQQGDQVGDAIVELGTTTEKILAMFTAIDLESAEDLQLDE